MPNWCENAVMLKGSTSEIEVIKDFLTEDNNCFSFNKILPIPKALRDGVAPLSGPAQKIEYNISKYGAKDWYDWSIANWGTKWNSSGIFLTSEYDDQVAYSFQTAWAPPIPVYTELAKLFPNINIFINYDESGMGFSGWQYYANGELVKKREYDESYYAIHKFMEPDSDVWEWLE